MDVPSPTQDSDSTAPQRPLSLTELGAIPGGSARADLQAPARGPVIGRRGVVASGQPLASLAGIDVLRAGGNAIDAAIAVSAVMIVVQPYSSHLGGDGFAMVHTAAGDTVAMNAGGRAPRAATPDRYPDGIPLRGATAVAVPGLVDSWCALHRRFGTKRLAELLAPAIGFAAGGFPVSRRLAGVIAARRELLAGDPGCAETFLNNETSAPGAVLRQPDLARTLEAIAAEGRDGFYAGAVGHRILASLRQGGSLMDGDDLAQDQAVWGEPLQVSYRDCTVFGQPLPSQGFLTLEALNIIEGFDFSGTSIVSADAVHPMVEAMLLAFADRDDFVGDPDAIDVPIERLLSKPYAAELRERIIAGDGVATPTNTQGGDTTSFAVADGRGNMVSFIQSVFHPWGAALLVPGAGVLLNDRMAGFSLDPAGPNFLRPGRRTVHTLNTWMLDIDDGRVYAGGTPGADFQVQTNLQVITGLVDWGLDPQSAVDAPKWALTGPGDLAMEARFPDETVSGLARRGRRIVPVSAWETSLCRSQMVARQPDGALLAASDLRGEGAALAY